MSDEAPKSWGAAIPNGTWGIIILGLGFVVAESLNEIIKNPYWRAGIAFAAMVVLTAILIHWPRIRRSVPTLFAVGVLVVVIALSPYVEQQRWPFSSTYGAVPATTPSRETADPAPLVSTSNPVPAESFPWSQRREFENAMQYRVLGANGIGGAVIRIYADAENAQRAWTLAEMIALSGLLPDRDQTGNPVWRPEFNVSAGITVRQGEGDQAQRVFQAIRQALSQAHIPYTDGATLNVTGPTRIEVGP